MKHYSINIDGNTLNCELKKRKRSKNIRIRVLDKENISVSLPYYTPYIYAKNFIHKNEAWIKKRVKEIELTQNQYYYLGNNISFIKKNYANILSFNYISERFILIVQSPDNKSDRELYLEWLKLEANNYIPKRVKLIAERYNFEYNSVKIKYLTSRWGSCSSKGILSFNLRLMYFNKDIIDYVIIHELCHTKEMNHSKNFWRLVEEIMPNYKEYRHHLKNNHLTT